MSESINDKISRFRKPRVHIKYDVETEGARIKVDLPFVVGVMGDFTGDPTEALKPLDERGFVQIDRNNFDAVLKRLKPGLDFKVENSLGDGSDEMHIQLAFKSMDDFLPANVANQVPALKHLLDTRNKLRDLLMKVDRSKDLEGLLDKVLQNTDDLKALSEELGIGGAPAGDDAGSSAGDSGDEPEG